LTVDQEGRIEAVNFPFTTELVEPNRLNLVVGGGKGLVNGSIRGKGNIYVSWTESFGNNDPKKKEVDNILFTCSSNCGKTWRTTNLSENQDLSSTFTSTGKDGNCLVFWTNSSGKTYFRHSSDFGLNWQPVQAISADTRIVATSYASSQDTGNHIHYVWGDLFSDEILYIQSTDYGISWSPKINISNAGPTSYGKVAGSYGPCIASINSQNIYVAWQDHSLDTYEIFFTYPDYPCCRTECFGPGSKPCQGGKNILHHDTKRICEV